MQKREFCRVYRQSDKRERSDGLTYATDRRSRRFAALVLTAALFFGGLFPGTVRADEDQHKVLRYVNYYPVDFGHINPSQEMENTEYTVAYHVLEGLMRIYQYQLQYGMADSYEISTDGLTYTFHIRENAYYSDGTPVTAYDFERAFNRVMKENPDLDYIRMIKNAEKIAKGTEKVGRLGVKTKNAYTFQIELEYPDARFLYYLALPAFAPVRKDAGEYVTAEACNGPFYLKEAEDGTFCRLEKNPWYWNRKHICLDAIESVYYPDSGKAREALREGKADVVPVATAELEEKEGEVGQKAMTGTYDGLYLDLHEESILRNRNLRLALNYCLDRKAYAEELGNGLIEPNARYVPPIGEGICQRYIKRNPDGGIPLKGDQEKAEKYLNLALEELHIADAAVIHLSFAVHDDYWSKEEAAAIAKQWEEKLGITVELNYMDDKTLSEKMEHNGGVALYGGQEEFSDPAEYLQRWDYEYLPKEQSNVRQFHQYMIQAKNQTDEQIRFNMLYEAERLLLEDSPYIPLQLRYEMLVLNPALTGFETSADLSGSQYEFIYADFKE